MAVPRALGKRQIRLGRCARCICRRNRLSSAGCYQTGRSALNERVHSIDGGGHRLVLLLAGLSVALNLLAGGAYIGSTYFATQQGRPNMFDRRFADLGTKLGADPAGDAGLTALRRSIRLALDVRHLRSQPLMEDITAEFAKPAPDEARIRALQDQALAVRRASGDETLAALIAFLVQATPDQRTKLLALLGEMKDESTMPLRFGLMP
ncbi:MAG: hypothetical protein JWO51_1822 [Rhodospirillales bacterium]|nr:hypothetical protein [Rhodospirillales bacterium]